MTIMFMTAERKALVAFAITVIAFVAALVLSGTPVLAQPQEPPPGGPTQMDDDDTGPPQQMGRGMGRGMRGEFREKMKQRRGMRQGEGGMRGGPGCQAGEDGPGCSGGPGGMGGNGPGGRMGGAGRLGRALDFIQSFHTSVQDPHQAIGLATLGIKQHYQRIGKPLEAVKELDELLKNAKDQKTRNILLFTTRQIYEEERDNDKFLAISRQIVKENLEAK